MAILTVQAQWSCAVYEGVGSSKITFGFFFFAADWSSHLVEQSWMHSAIRERESISKCGEISTMC